MLMKHCIGTMPAQVPRMEADLAQAQAESGRHPSRMAAATPEIFSARCSAARAAPQHGPRLRHPEAHKGLRGRSVFKWPTPDRPQSGPKPSPNMERTRGDTEATPNPDPAATKRPPPRFDRGATPKRLRSDPNSTPTMERPQVDPARGPSLAGIGTRPDIDRFWAKSTKSGPSGRPVPT